MDPENTTMVWSLGATNVLTLFFLLLKFRGAAEKREIQSPLRIEAEPHFAPLQHTHPDLAPSIHEHPQYFERHDYKSEVAKEDERHRRLDVQARDDRRSVYERIEDLSLGIRKDLSTHNKLAEERASLIHQRINGIAEPVAALRARVEDHIQDKRAHLKGGG